MKKRLTVSDTSACEQGHSTMQADLLTSAGLLLVSVIPACNPALPGVFE